ncbi:MAG: diacylglycerol/lipid kinase family protein, partial [Bacteroidota bacterium]
GLLDVVVVRFAPIPRLAEVAARLLAGDYTNSEAVFHRRVRSLSVHSTPDMWFNLDGELITMEEISFRVMPGAINVLVGPDYRAEPPEE